MDLFLHSINFYLIVLTLFKTKRRLAHMIISMHKAVIRVARKLAWHCDCVRMEKIIN